MRPDQHVVEDAEVAEHAAVLERAREAGRGQPFRPRPGHVGAGEAHRAGIRPVEAADQVEQRGFAGAIWADDADELAIGHVEVNAGHRRDALEAPDQAAHLQQRAGHHTVPSSPCGR